MGTNDTSTSKLNISAAHAPKRGLKARGKGKIGERIDKEFIFKADFT